MLTTRPSMLAWVPGVSAVPETVLVTQPGRAASSNIDAAMVVDGRMGDSVVDIGPAQRTRGGFSTHVIREGWSLVAAAVVAAAPAVQPLPHSSRRGVYLSCEFTQSHQ